jgi:exodeoxyribonuclease VII large subunit
VPRPPGRLTVHPSLPGGAESTEPRHRLGRVTHRGTVRGCLRGRLARGPVSLSGEGARLPGVLPGERTDALSIAALYTRVQAVLGRAFGRGEALWVQGEIQSISDRTGHCYIDLVDPDARGRSVPVLKVNCWAKTWTPLKAMLNRQGIALEPGLVVTLQGRVEIYPPRGQLNFIATELDVTALLGRLAARRAALLGALESEGILRRNRGLSVAPLALTVGLVASRDTEGYRDFTGQLRASGFGFRVLHVPVTVQGTHAPHQIAAAITGLCRAGCDVVVVVRGGGSKGDLSAFDSEPVARAIAGASVAVWTGIGHTGDQAVADIVANRSFVTPTECGAELVSRVGQCWDHLADTAAVVARRATEVTLDSLRRDTQARTRLCASARNQLDRHAERVHVRALRLASVGPRCVEQESESLEWRASRAARSVIAQFERLEDRVDSWRRLIAAYDVDRQLERGYTITLREDGSLIRSASELEPGATMSTRFADGRAMSRVSEIVNDDR